MSDKKCPHCRAQAVKVTEIDKTGKKTIHYVCIREPACAMEREAKAKEQAMMRKAA